MRNLGEIGTILLCVTLSAAGQIALKIGASAATLEGLAGSGNLLPFLGRALLSPMVAAGLLLYGMSTALWLVILARSDLSYAYPFVSIGFVLTTLYGWHVLGESVTPLRSIGTLMIIAGVCLVAKS